MRTFLASIVLFFSMTLVAAACPNWEFGGATFNYTGEQLYSPQQLNGAAIGGYDLTTCNTGDAFTRGYAGAAPNYTLNLTGMDQYYLVLDVDSQCDATMLLRAADGSWHFDDDSNGNLDPRLELRGANLTNGQVYVWIGTYDNSSCGASLGLETFFDAAVPAPAPAPTPAGLCPDWSFQGVRIDATGAGLSSGGTYPLTAMGGGSLSDCTNVPGGRGFAPQAPQYSFWLSEMAGYELDLRITANCDATMVVNTADTTWYFDDDSGDGLNPALRVPGGIGLEGRVDVWIGTYSGGDCPASLSVQAVSASVPAPAPAPAPAPVPAPVGGCPSFGAPGPIVTATGSILYSPQRYDVQAGGQTDLSGCNIPGVSFGFANGAPTYTFNLSGMEEYGRLEIEVDSDCDPLLVVRAANGQWFFNDDSDGLNPTLDITGAGSLNGRVDVWVGTYNGVNCPATLEMETWYN